MQGRHSQLEYGQEMSIISQKDFNLGSILKRTIDAINSLAQNIGATAVGKIPPPPPINSIQVQGALDSTKNILTAPSEILHWTMTHNGEIGKGVHYFTEIDTNRNFTQPHVISHGTSRTGFLSLPSFDNNNVLQTYYMRSYPQMPGGDAQKPTVVGGLANATQIQMTGTSKTSLLSSTGSGTASPQGTQGGKGFGDVLTRPAPTTKRSVARL